MATKKNTNINGHDYYRIRRTIDGKVKSFYGSSKGDAEKQFKEYIERKIEEAHQEAHILDSSTFSDRADEFIENALKTSTRYAQGTVTRYLSAYNTHIKPHPIIKKVVTKIKASDIQKFYNSLDVSQSTMKQIHKFMSAFYKWMVRNDYAHDVLSAVELPKKKDTKRHDDIVVWEEEEVQQILSNLDGYRLRFLIIVLLYTGSRVGEALALRYSDIEDEVIHIKRQYFEKEIKEPKMGSSRDIPIHPVLRKELAIHKDWHEKEMKRKGYTTDYIFTSDTGHLLERGNLRRSLNRFYDRFNIPQKHNHAYRGTFCTQLCKCGVPLEVASKLLGHKDITVTAQYYALIQPATKQDAINSLHY